MYIGTLVQNPHELEVDGRRILICIFLCYILNYLEDRNVFILVEAG